jgi:hypothetical protein
MRTAMPKLRLNLQRRRERWLFWSSFGGFE